MKISPLVLLPVASASVSDSSSLLAVATQSSMAKGLLSAVGHRNVTHMEAMVQELVEESISEPGWKFDADIQAALEAIRNMFVKSIQNSLNDAHKEDQEDMNCFTQQCFGDCVTELHEHYDRCDSIFRKCENMASLHVECRYEVKGIYMHMAQSCGALHSFIQGWQDEECTPEKCLCPDLLNCHRKEGAYGTCEAADRDCPSGYGSWLKRMIQKYQSGYEEWSKLYDDCKHGYHAFLTADMHCDKTQKEFEQCQCQGNQCDSDACDLNYDQCQATCWMQYENKVKEKECLEKDRKIDWSATKKIECYIDVLLHDYTKDELLSKCGTEDCINKAREEDYKHCATICPEVDFLGAWPEVTGHNPVQVAGHARREAGDQYHLGDGDYRCDANGAAVFSKHRSTREEETRCTEHLDIDYQIPECVPCRDPPPPICDADFHYKWYAQFDSPARMPEISDCCMAGGKTCFADVVMPMSLDGDEMQYTAIAEHSHAWAFNRCPCLECVVTLPAYSARPDHHQCGMGAHTISPGKPKETKIEFNNVCIQPRNNGFATLKLEHDACVSEIQFTHVSGKVSCRKAARGDSNWGCDSHSVGLVIGDGESRVVAPVFGTTVGMTPHYSGHAHWYKMDGVNEDTKVMHWVFHEPAFVAGGAYGREYKLWYNEDLTGGTEGDNRGEACYDIKMETADTCNILAPLQFPVCAGAHGGQSHTINLPADTCVTRIDLHHVNGYVSCAGGKNGAGQKESAGSNFGCGHNLVGMVFTPQGKQNVVMPTTDVEGLTRTTHSHAHWYYMNGVTQFTRTLTMKLKDGVAPLKTGPLDLWYNEDLTGGTEADNHGKACYEIAVHRALHC